jgi:alpha-D-ribose 1-methylphosphonate 5-triphosphate synthase subunit PhnG
MFRPLNITATSSGTVGGVGSWPQILSVTINTAAPNAVLKLYQGQAAVAGNLFATIDCSSTRCIVYLVECKDGFSYALSGGNADITISYQ